MKIDIDSIFYIILSIIILVISGLGRRRKKQAQQMKVSSASSLQPGATMRNENKIVQPRRPAMDPFERLEQILTGQSSYETLEGDSLDIENDEEEMILDDEEKLINSQLKEQKEEDVEIAIEQEVEDQKLDLDGLFKDIDEVTRAVIYSEILPRKYT